MIDSGARASVTNMLHLLHNIHFHTPQRPCPLRMCGATDKKVMIVPVAVGHLRITALTLQGWIEVKTHCSLMFTSTLLNEQDLIHATGFSKDCSGLTVQKHFNPTKDQFQDASNRKLKFDKHHHSDTGKVVVTCHHKQVNRKDLVITGVIIFGSACTHPLIPPVLPKDHPIATNQKLINQAKANDPAFLKSCNDATAAAIHTHRLELRILQDELEELPLSDGNHPHCKLIFQQTPVHASQTKTERKPWHLCLCHFSPAITAHAHKHCKGVPEFKGEPSCPNLDQCTACVQAKLKKVPSGQHSLEASVPCQGSSVDFALAGMVSEDKKRCTDVEGTNGETCFLLIQDKFTKIVHSDVRMSKAPPVDFIDKFLKTYAPIECQNKFVTLDQGGELCGSPQVQKLFKKHDCAVCPAAPDASRQNSVERYHQTITNAVQAVLMGANLPVKFWPHAVLHAVQVFNSLPSTGQSKSKLELATNSKEDWSKLKSLGLQGVGQISRPTLCQVQIKCKKRNLPGLHSPHHWKLPLV